ncbi:hypothetical protein [Candidatus Nitrospira bockiana]
MRKDSGCFVLLGVVAALALPSNGIADKPCDDYPAADRSRCERLWKQINREAEAEMAEFGLRQLKRREAGTITAEQHLSQNFAFIKASGEKRLRLLRERMGAR